MRLAEFVEQAVGGEGLFVDGGAAGVAVFQQMPQLDPVWRLLLVTGFLGALTTFSSFSAEVVGMLVQGRYPLALATAAVHLLGSLLLTIAGIKTAMWFMLR